MKKFLAALAMLAVFITSSIAFAAYEENIEDDANLGAIKKIAVAFPNYYKIEEAEPDIYDLARDIYNAGRFTSSREIVSYEDVASAIRRDTGIDIHSLDVVEAEKVYNQNVGRYADTYVITTVTNNSKRPWLFFYLYNAADSKLMYTYSIQSNVLDKSAKDYGKAAEDFFKQLDETAKKNLSKEERRLLEEKQKAARIYKRHVEKVTYKTGKDKVDMVRKK
ncbi:MAG: hypothetical protein IJK81_06870 [Selenomonadaceae bacterium]|nr:hypothetical protein [Selenomonadaceae bacterium]